MKAMGTLGDDVKHGMRWSQITDSIEKGRPLPPWVAEEAKKQGRTPEQQFNLIKKTGNTKILYQRQANFLLMLSLLLETF